MSNIRLYHLDLIRARKTGLRSIINRQGPVRENVDGMYPDEFIDAVTLEVKGRHLLVEVSYGAHKDATFHKHLRTRSAGRVGDRFTAALVSVLNDLYVSWLGWRGDITTEPPKDCPNDVHAKWADEPVGVHFVPDSGLWRCIGCGWLVDADGTRIREHYDSVAVQPRGATKVGALLGDD